MNTTIEEIKSEVQFNAWMQIGVGTPRDILMKFAVGTEDWKKLTMAETADRFEMLHEIDIRPMGIWKALKTMREKWEESNGSLRILRDSYFAEEYSLLDKPYIS